jgi:hypothetical protein
MTVEELTELLDEYDNDTPVVMEDKLGYAYEISTVYRDHQDDDDTSIAVIVSGGMAALR